MKQNVALIGLLMASLLLVLTACGNAVKTTETQNQVKVQSSNVAIGDSSDIADTDLLEEELTELEDLDQELNLEELENLEKDLDSINFE